MHVVVRTQGLRAQLENLSFIYFELDGMKCDHRYVEKSDGVKGNGRTDKKYIRTVLIHVTVLLLPRGSCTLATRR